jgi:hypothetical protein
MRRTTSIWLWLGVSGLLASCSMFSRTPLVTPGPAGSTDPGVLRTFDEGGLTFTYPVAWHELHFTVDSSFSHLITDLATVEVPVPCATTVTPSFTEIACADRYQLVPNSLVVSVSSGGMPGFDILGRRPVGATPLTVGGLPAYFESAPATAPAEASLVWTISSPGLVDNFYQVQADLRGPGLDQMRGQLEAMIKSLRYDPPFVPLPSGSTAMTAAATSALAALVKDSSVWSCFSLSGPRSMVIDSMPNGPPLARPQLATCTMRIEATPLQLWRMTLSLRLAKPDPNVGGGETFTQWVNPDGTLGGSEGGPLVP